MAQGARSAMVSRAVVISRILGFCIYVTAFFLPACREKAFPGGDAPDVFPGYKCAWMTLVNSCSAELWHSKYFLAILSGWINPLILLYLILLLMPKFIWPRRIVAGTIALFIAGTWILFVMIPLVPLVGHVLWIAGILLMIAAEALRQGKTAPAA
jgi:hypothetical protein